MWIVTTWQRVAEFVDGDHIGIDRSVAKERRSNTPSTTTAFSRLKFSAWNARQSKVQSAKECRPIKKKTKHTRFTQNLNKERDKLPRTVLAQQNKQGKATKRTY